MHDTKNSHDPKTYLLVDPTSPDGESALDLLDESDTHVSVVVLLTGRMSAALKAFAVGADIDLPTAGWTYLDQVADRISKTGRVIETVVANGPNPADELTQLAHSDAVRRILVPSSLERLDTAAHRRLVETADIAVHAPTMAAVA